MPITDARLSAEEKGLLASAVGGTLEAFSHDEYLTSSPVHASTCISAWLTVDGNVIEIHDEIAPLDYFGELEDVAVVSVRIATEGEIRSHLVGCKTVADKIERTIKDIKVLEDTQLMLEGNEAEHAYSFTAAIVLELEGTELVFEFGPWFSEDILVKRGPGASRTLPEAIEAIPEEDREYYWVEREIVSLREWAEGRRTP